LLVKIVSKNFLESFDMYDQGNIDQNMLLVKSFRKVEEVKFFFLRKCGFIVSNEWILFNELYLVSIYQLFITIN